MRREDVLRALCTCVYKGSAMKVESMEIGNR